MSHTGKRIVLVLLLVQCLLAASTLLAQEKMSAEEIVKRSQQTFFYAGEDMKAKVRMRLINPQGGERVRAMTMLRRDEQEGGEQKYFIVFHQPADVRDMAFMVWKYPGKDDDRWLYIPAVKLVRRIAANDRRSSFVGSDFSYEDISGRDVEEDRHTLVKEESLDGRPCYVVESVPGDPGSADYSRKVSYIDRANFLPLKEEYYDRRGDLARAFTADEVKEAQGLPTVTKRTMKNLQNGHRTEVTFEEVRYNLGLSDGLFSERSLRQPPAEAR
jgi:outer membrane lipoprotein-sorting protein